MDKNLRSSLSFGQKVADTLAKGTAHVTIEAKASYRHGKRVYPIYVEIANQKLVNLDVVSEAYCASLVKKS
jgi:hypothetical protein